MRYLDATDSTHPRRRRTSRGALLMRATISDAQTISARTWSSARTRRRWSVCTRAACPAATDQQYQQHLQAVLAHRHGLDGDTSVQAAAFGAGSFNTDEARATATASPRRSARLIAALVPDTRSPQLPARSATPSRRANGSTSTNGPRRRFTRDRSPARRVELQFAPSLRLVRSNTKLTSRSLAARASNAPMSYSPMQITGSDVGRLVLGLVLDRGAAARRAFVR